MFGEAADFGEEPSRVQGWGSTEYTSWKKPGQTTHDFCVYLVNAILLIHPSPPPFPLQNHEFMLSASVSLFCVLIHVYYFLYPHVSGIISAFL